MSLLKIIELTLKKCKKENIKIFLIAKVCIFVYKLSVSSILCLAFYISSALIFQVDFSKLTIKIKMITIKCIFFVH